MRIRTAALATVFAASLGMIGMPAEAQQRPDGQQVNPSPMPPGSTAGTAPGMNPGAAPAGTAQGGTADRGTVGGTGAQAPSGQPDVGRGTAQVQTPRAQDNSTGATTPNRGATSGGADPTPPAATTQHTEPRTAAAPVPGANSFTEGQARARIGDAGFTDVQGLRLDDQGIWRGRAMRNGQQTGVALDYQGNVVATQ